jgi:hypothetical protein
MGGDRFDGSYDLTSSGLQFKRRRPEMPRAAGDRYVCEKCGAELVYEKGCPCPAGMPHSEICCGEQMKKK